MILKSIEVYINYIAVDLRLLKDKVLQSIYRTEYYLCIRLLSMLYIIIISIYINHSTIYTIIH